MNVHVISFYLDEFMFKLKDLFITWKTRLKEIKYNWMVVVVFFFSFLFLVWGVYYVSAAPGLYHNIH